MGSDAGLYNYQVEWAPAAVAGWSPSGSDHTSRPPFTFVPEVAGRSAHEAWKVRVRTRTWIPFVGYCCGGPWSDPLVIDEYEPVP